MAIESRSYEFIGGSLDGQVVRIGGSTYPGSRWWGQTVPGRKREIYVLKEDGKYHFERYGLELNPRADSLEATEELEPIEQKIAELLKEMDAVLEKYGGPSSSSITIGNWTIRHKDA